MTVKEFYAAIGGNYEDAIKRLMNDAFVTKFVGKFLADKNCENMIKAFESGDYQTAFTASHTLKGICANLSFTELQNVADRLCETVRHGAPTEDVSGMLEEAKKSYAKLILNIGLLTEGK